MCNPVTPAQATEEGIEVVSGALALGARFREHDEMLRPRTFSDVFVEVSATDLSTVEMTRPVK